MKGPSVGHKKYMKGPSLVHDFTTEQVQGTPVFTFLLPPSPLTLA